MATQNAVNLKIVSGGGHTYTFPSADSTLATLALTEALTNKSVNGVTLDATGAATLYLDKTGAYSTPAGSGGSMTYPTGTGIAVVTSGTSWGTTLTAPTSAIVGISDTQTLTNKTIDGVTPTTMGYLDATSSIQTQLNAKGAGTVTGTGTTNQLSYWTSTTAQGTLTTATYPSLTELAYVKGVTSAIQTQFTGKAATNQTMYIGTTAVAINRTSAALTLAGITLTTPTISSIINTGTLTLPTTTGTLALTSQITGTNSGTNTGDNSANTTYASDYRAANFVAGTNYLAPTGSAASLTSFPTLNQNTTGTAAGLSATLAIASGGTGATTLAGASIPTYSSADTFTNKRITKRVLALSANSATPSINTDSYDVVHITAQTATITGFTMTGTPVDGDTLRISITGTAAVPFTLGSSFEASGGQALSTTTITTARLDMGFFWNSETSKWRQVAAA